MTNDGAAVEPLTDSATMLPERHEPWLASWAMRVIASLLDGAIGTGATFLLLGSPNVPVPFLGASLLQPGVEELAAISWSDSGWIVAVTLVIAAMQAYLGVTPGKMLIGIAVVGESDARPVGLLRTGVRWFAHILDSILMIGYLRPLWNARRKTFADSIMGTVVLVTRRPRQHRWIAPRFESAADPGPPRSWEAPTTPGWRQAATAVCAVVCGVGVLFSIDFSGQQPGPMALDCELSGPYEGSAGLTGGSLNLTSVDSTSTRLGVTRHTPGSGGPITATWQWSVPLPPQRDMALRSSFTRADGTGARHYDFPAPEPTAGEATISLPPEAVRGLGDSWTWTQTILVDGVESRSCTGSL